MLLGLIDVADPVVVSLLSRHGVQPADLFDAMESCVPRASRPRTC